MLVFCKKNNLGWYFFKFLKKGHIAMWTVVNLFPIIKLMKLQFAFILGFLSFSCWSKVTDLAVCSQKYSSNEIQEERYFKISRDGDRLFSKFRESKVEEYEISDDVTMRVFVDAALEDFFKKEENQPIINAFDSSRNKIKKVYFFGVDQQDLPEEESNLKRNKYRFELWFGENEFSSTKVVLVREGVSACDEPKTLWPFLVKTF